MRDGNSLPGPVLKLTAAEEKGLEELNAYDERQLAYALKEALKRKAVHARYKLEGKA